ncbi:collagen alpha-1(I) chain-like isoform X3 [Onychostruthus taczanowskii]|uniref:collagen alpha-1(I) chain-like isoform X3 n=1 Tax=Onychostruthus taczanowskii TaxID=356909 RepID=UPI001B807AD3|nr:collagen alpha-1(I) chain-like isoform X3 [Onychostruthus taczanowskii]
MAKAQEQPPALSDVQVKACGALRRAGRGSLSAAFPLQHTLPRELPPRGSWAGALPTGEGGWQPGRAIPGPAAALPRLLPRSSRRTPGPGSAPEAPSGAAPSAATGGTRLLGAPQPRVRETWEEIPAGKLGRKKRGSPATCSRRRGAAEEPPKRLCCGSWARLRPGMAEGQSPAVPRVSHPPPRGGSAPPVPPAGPGADGRHPPGRAAQPPGQRIRPRCHLLAGPLLPHPAAPPVPPGPGRFPGCHRAAGHGNHPAAAGPALRARLRRLSLRADADHGAEPLPGERLAGNSLRAGLVRPPPCPGHRCSPRDAGGASGPAAPLCPCSCLLLIHPNRDMCSQSGGDNNAGLEEKIVLLLYLLLVLGCCSLLYRRVRLRCRGNAALPLLSPAGDGGFGGRSGRSVGKASLYFQLVFLLCWTPGKPGGVSPAPRALQGHSGGVPPRNVPLCPTHSLPPRHPLLHQHQPCLALCPLCVHSPERVPAGLPAQSGLRLDEGELPTGGAGPEPLPAEPRGAQGFLRRFPGGCSLSSHLIPFPGSCSHLIPFPGGCPKPRRVLHIPSSSGNPGMAGWEGTSEPLECHPALAGTPPRFFQPKL